MRFSPRNILLLDIITMERVTSITELEKQVHCATQKGSVVGFVPTMGFLHSGHIHLVKVALEQCDFVVVSIYVNPSQFNDVNDFKHYPKDLKRDQKLLEASGCHVLWTPTQRDIEGLKLPESYESDELDKVLEGQYRPGHFKGVKEVVFRLFSAVKPDIAFFGEKDFQQLAIIRALVKNNDMPIKIVGVATQREQDGLAMSSRNVRLSETQRKVASKIFQVLQELANAGTSEHNLEHRIETAKDELRLFGFQVEYLEVHQMLEDKRLFIAAFLGDVRLIDNFSISKNF